MLPDHKLLFSSSLLYMAGSSSPLDIAVARKILQKVFSQFDIKIF